MIALAWRTAAVGAAVWGTWWIAAQGARRVPPGWYWTPLPAVPVALAVAAACGAVAAWRAGGPGLDRAAEGSAAPSRARAVRAQPGWWADIAAGVSFLAAGAGLQVWWVARVNPFHVLIGADHASFAANTISAGTGDWGSYNTDKPALHPLLSAWVARGSGDAAESMLFVSAASIALLPFLAWAMARPLFGRVAALVSGLCVLLDAETWSYAVQTTSYALYAALVTAALAALAAWASAVAPVARRGPGGRMADGTPLEEEPAADRVAWRTVAALTLAAASGALAALSFATSEKTIVTLGVPFAGICAWTIVRARGARGSALAAVGVALLALVGTLRATHAPVTLTPLGNLIGNQRSELHVMYPYRWTTTARIDPARPYPYVEYVPDALRSASLDVTVSALLAPPNANVLRIFAGGRVGPMANSTIPPRAVLFAHNLREFTETRRPALARVALFAAGTAGCAASVASAPGVALAVAAASGVAPLNLKYQDRYYLHLLPLGWVVTVGGLSAAVRRLAGRSSVGRAVGSGVVLWLVGALLVCAQQRDADAWRWPRSGTWPPPAALGGGTARDLDGIGVNTRVLAEALLARDRAEWPVDCSPHPVAAYAPVRWRLRTAAQRRFCERALDAPSGTRVAVSAHPESRGADTVPPDALRAAGWIEELRAEHGRVTESPRTAPMKTSAVSVYRKP